MSKIIISPIEEFKGTITLREPLFLSHCKAIEDALGDPNDREKRLEWLTVKDERRLNALIVCSEAWAIEGQPIEPTMETFVLTPRPKTNELIKWAWSELLKIYFGEITVPNE